MWKPTLPSWVPGRRAEGGGITPGSRTVPPGVLVFDGENKDLWWVKVILNVGRPVVAVIVLIMCAPGEHYLARMAGWSHWLAWGMPATLTAYAGIAAVVATKRPKKSPGKITAVAGAIISVTLAMGAQPIAHLYQRGLVTGHQTLLTIIVSCIPALVFGHLLHMAAAPVVVPGKTALMFDRDTVAAPVDDDEENDLVEYSPDAFEYRATDDHGGTDASIDYLRTAPDWHAGQLRQDALDAINRPAPDMSQQDLRDTLASVPVRGWQADLVIVGDVPPADISRDNPQDNEEDNDQGQTAVSGPVPGHRDTDTGDRGTGRDRPRSVPSRHRSGTGITSRVRDILADNPGATDEDIKDAFDPSVSRNSIGKSIKRVREQS